MLLVVLREVDVAAVDVKAARVRVHRVRAEVKRVQNRLVLAVSVHACGRRRRWMGVVVDVLVRDRRRATDADGCGREEGVGEVGLLALALGDAEGLHLDEARDEFLGDPRVVPPDLGARLVASSVSGVAVAPARGERVSWRECKGVEGVQRYKPDEDLINLILDRNGAVLVRDDVGVLGRWVETGGTCASTRSGTEPSRKPLSGG